jgi:hypothetical protein
MKKLIFLMLATVLLSGIAFAVDSPAHQPWAISLEAAAVAESVADGVVVAQQSDLVLVVLGMEQRDSVMAAMADDVIAKPPDSGIMLMAPLIVGQIGTVTASANYYLRC